MNTHEDVTDQPFLMCVEFEDSSILLIQGSVTVKECDDDSVARTPQQRLSSLEECRAMSKRGRDGVGDLRGGLEDEGGIVEVGEVRGRKQAVAVVRVGGKKLLENKGSIQNYQKR